MINMLFGVDTKKDNDWWIGSNTPNTNNLSKFESLLFQGNGYLGIRGTFEEHYLNEKRDMFILGTFDKFQDEPTELPNLPDIVNLEIKINGKIFNLDQGEVTNYQRGLNLKNGEVTRSFDWKFDKEQFKFEFRRFVFEEW